MATPAMATKTGAPSRKATSSTTSSAVDEPRAAGAEPSPAPARHARRAPAVERPAGRARPAGVAATEAAPGEEQRHRGASAGDRHDELAHRHTGISARRGCAGHHPTRRLDEAHRGVGEQRGHRRRHPCRRRGRRRRRGRPSGKSVEGGERQVLAVPVASSAPRKPTQRVRCCTSTVAPGMARAGEAAAPASDATGRATMERSTTR